MTDLTDAAPPGSWLRFADHFPHALTPEYFRLFRSTFEPSQAEVYRNYGVPFGGLEVALIGGHLFLAPVPLVGKMDTSLPPKPVLWAATRLHPEFKRRRARARAVLRDRPWLDDVHEWRHELRPLWTRANLALQGEPLGSMDEEDLEAHLRRCRANAEEGYRLHFRLHGPDLMATGLLLARGEDWGIDPQELLGVLVGTSPASTGADPDLVTLRGLVARSGAQPASVEELRALGPDIERTLDAYLEQHGWRVVAGYDLDGRCLNELPGLVLSLVSAPPERPTAPTDVSALRDRVPERDRPEFDRRLTDARFTYGLRDENGGLTGAWPVGLLRRAMLEAGRRLAGRGLLAEAAHAVEVTVDELLGLLAGTSALTAETVVARAVRRAEASRRSPPDTIGPPLPGPEALRPFPEPLRLMVRAQLALVAGSWALRRPDPLTGTGIGTSPVMARACVAHDAGDALARLQPGEVLVTASTSPAFNASLSIAGGLVVEQGGYLSHAAVMARELGLPAIVGAAGAADQIPDGAVVEIDPARGVARVVEGAGLAP